MSGPDANALGGHQFLRGMRTEHLERLAAVARYENLPAGHRLFDEGRRADRFWLIQTGQIAIDARVPGRGGVRIQTLAGGTVLGWSWLFPPHRWRFGAVATTPVHTISLDAPAVRKLCDADPELGYELHRRFSAILLDRLQNTRMRLVDVHATSAERSPP